MGRITRLASLSTIALFHICSLTVQLPAARATADTFASGVNSFEVEFVEIGNPGNMADSVTVFGFTTTYGSVDYVYNIGKYEISRDMVTRANAEGDLRITLDDMDIVTNGPRNDMPATGVSWNEAARFVNWLNIHQRTPGWPLR